MANLKEATKDFIEAMSHIPSSQEDINVTLQECLRLLSQSSEVEVETFMKEVFELTSLPDQQLASFASNICGYLVEMGYSSRAILDELINFYDIILDKSRVFFEVLSVSIANITCDDEKKKEKIEQIYSDLLNDPDIVNDDTFRAINDIDTHYTSAISLFSVDRSNLLKAKRKLEEKVAIAQQYSQGCYWLNLLFKTLFDASVIIIDLDTKKGIAGKINGITDNYQLQHLLMGLPQFNPVPSISDADLAVANGSGKQIEDRDIISKWNLYNLELCAQDNWQELINTDNSKNELDFRHTWIWPEGVPNDITIHGGYRVILLSKASSERSSKVQRTFKNLKASIEVERELSIDEINDWFNYFEKK